MPKLVSKTGRMLNYYANHVLTFRTTSHFRKAYAVHKDQMTAGLTEYKRTEHSQAPLIILGMHRSGTTLMSQLLREAGLYMGWLRGSDTDESLLFQVVNRAILSLRDSDWDEPEPFIEAMNNPGFSDAVSEILDGYCGNAAKTITYRGRSRNRGTSLFDQSRPWGWKDPRTCITLPLWLRLFPEARVLFIYRNAIDVCNSLKTRNDRYKNNKAYSKRCETLEGAYGIWKVYNEQCLAHINILDQQRLYTLRYEDLLTNPLEHLQKVLDFAHIDLNTEATQSISQKIDHQRAFAFTHNTELRAFYEKVKDDALMRKFEYSDVLSQAIVDS